MNIPVDNSNNLQSNSNPLQTSPLNIEIEEDDQDVRDEEQQQIEILHQDDGHRDDHGEQQNQQQSQRYHSFNEYPEENEQLEVFVGFYRPGEYERENVEEDDEPDNDDDDDDDSDQSQRLKSEKKEEQVRHIFSPLE